MKSCLLIVCDLSLHSKKLGRLLFFINDYIFSWLFILIMKHLLLVLVLSLFAQFSFAQLDSAKIETQYTYIEVPGDSLNTGNMLQVKIWVNDYDFLGQVIIDVIDVESGFPLLKLKKSKEELVLTKESNTNWSLVNIAILDQTRTYTIKATVQNFQNYALPELVKTQNGIN